MPAFRCRTGRKGRETHSCTHIPILGQPVVPAHESSGRINAGEVLPWDPQDPVIFSTITLWREQTQSEMSLCAGFETKTQISQLLPGTPRLPTLPKGRHTQQRGYTQPEHRGFIHPIPLGSRAKLDLLGNELRTGQEGQIHARLE